MAASIAHDIRTQGHYQGHPGQSLCSVDYQKDMCCPLANPTMIRVHGVQVDDHASPVEKQRMKFIRDAYSREMHKRIGEVGIAQWSNATPTEQVLAVLDNIASTPTPLLEKP